MNLTLLLRSREVRGVSSPSLTQRNCIDSLRESGLRNLRNEDASGEISKKLLRASDEVVASVGESTKSISRSVAICLAWAQDGSVFACGHGDHTIRVYDQSFQSEFQSKYASTSNTPTGEGRQGNASRPLAVLGSIRQGSAGDRRDEKTRTTWSLSFHPHRSDVLVSGALALPVEGIGQTETSLSTSTSTSSSSFHRNDNFNTTTGQRSAKRDSKSYTDDDDSEDDNDVDNDDDYFEPEDLIHTRNSFGASQRHLDSHHRRRKMRMRRRRGSSSSFKQHKRLALADSVRLVSHDKGKGLSVDKAFTVPEMEADISIWHWPTGSKLFSTKTLGGNVFSVKFSPCGSCVLAAVGTSLQVWAYADEIYSDSSSNNRRQSHFEYSDSSNLHDMDATSVLNDAILQASRATDVLFSNSSSCSSFSTTTLMKKKLTSSCSTTTLPLVHFAFNVRTLAFVDEELSSSSSSSSSFSSESSTASSTVRVVVALQRSYDDGFVDSLSASFGVPSSPSSPSPEQSVGGNLMMFLLDVPLLRALIRRHYRIQQRSLDLSTHKENEWIAPSFSPPPTFSSASSSRFSSSSVYAAPWLRPIVPPNLALEVSRSVARELDAGEKTMSGDPEGEEDDEEEEEEEENDNEAVEKEETDNVAERNLISFCGTMDGSDDHLTTDDDDSSVIEEEKQNGEGTKRRRRSSLPHEQVTEALLSSYVTSSPVLFGPRMVRRLLLSHTHVASRGLNGYFGVGQESDDQKLNFGPCPLLGPVLISRRALVYGDGSLSVGSVRLSMSGERLGAAFVSTPLTTTSLAAIDDTASSPSLFSSSFDLKALAAKRTEHLTSNERASFLPSTQVVVVNQIKLEENYIGGVTQMSQHRDTRQQQSAGSAVALSANQHVNATTTSSSVSNSVAPLLLPSSSTTNPFSFPSLKSLFGLGSSSSSAAGSTSGSLGSTTTSPASAASTSAAATSSTANSLLAPQKLANKTPIIPLSSISAVTMETLLPSTTLAAQKATSLNSESSSSSTSPSTHGQLTSVSYSNSAALTPVGDLQLSQALSSRKRSIADVANLSDRRWSSLSGSGSRGVSFSSQASSSMVLPSGVNSMDTQTGPRKLSGVSRNPTLLRSSLSSTLKTRQQQVVGGGNSYNNNYHNINSSYIDAPQQVSRGGSFASDIATSPAESVVTYSDQTLSVIANSAMDAFEVDTEQGTSSLSNSDLSTYPRRSHHFYSSPTLNNRKQGSRGHSFLAGGPALSSSVTMSAGTFDRERESSGSLSTLANALNSLALSEQRTNKNSASYTRNTSLFNRGGYNSTEESFINRLVIKRKTPRPILIVNDDVLPIYKRTLDPEREDSLELATRFLLVSFTQRLLHWHLLEDLNSDSLSAVSQRQQNQYQQQQYQSPSSTSLHSKATVFIREIQLPHMKWTRARTSSNSYRFQRHFGRLSHAESSSSNDEGIDCNTSYRSALSVTRHVFRFGRIISALPVGAGIAVAQITSVQLSPLGGHVMLAVEGVERKTTSPLPLVSVPSASGATSGATAVTRSFMRIFSPSSPPSSPPSYTSYSLSSAGLMQYQAEGTIHASRRSRLLIRTLSLASGDPSFEISTIIPFEWNATSAQTSPSTTNTQNTTSALQLFKERMFSVNVAAWSPRPSSRRLEHKNSNSSCSPLVGLALATQGGLVFRTNA